MGGSYLVTGCTVWLSHCDRDAIENHLLTEMLTAATASIHHGSMTVKVFQGREGRRQDYQVF